VRAVLISQIAPAVEGYTNLLRALGHEPVALLCVRDDVERYGELTETLVSIPPELDVIMPSRRSQIAPLLRAYDPDLVIYGMVLNDPVQSPSFHARQAYLNDWIVDRSRMLEGRPSPRLGFFDSRVTAWMRERAGDLRVGHDTTRWYIDMFGEPNRAGWQGTQDELKQMNERMRERGGVLLVALWPLLVGLDGRYPFEPIHRTVARFCLASGIAESDLLPALRGREPASLWVHPIDMHPNEIAHRLAAAELAPAVRALAPPPRD